MTHDNTSRASFRGSLFGVAYDDPAEFEQVARANGFRPGQGQTRGRSWREGTEVRVTFDDGAQVRGQVWCRSQVRGYVWLALDDGRYVHTHCGTGNTYATEGSSIMLGRVA